MNNQRLSYTQAAHNARVEETGTSTEYIIDTYPRGEATGTRSSSGEIPRCALAASGFNYHSERSVCSCGIHCFCCYKSANLWGLRKLAKRIRPITAIQDVEDAAAAQTRHLKEAAHTRPLEVSFCITDCLMKLCSDQEGVIMQWSISLTKKHAQQDTQYNMMQHIFFSRHALV